MSQEYFADLYEWLGEAYDAAMMTGNPRLAMEYVSMMRAMETAGVVTVEKVGETVH